MNNTTFYIKGEKNKFIFYIHGLTGAPSEMQGMAKMLNKEGFAGYTPLIMGHCKGIEALKKTSWQDWYNGLAEDFKKVTFEYGKVHIIGLCAGGTLALLLANEFPHLIKSIAIYSPILKYNGWAMNFYYSWANLLLNPTLKMLPFLQNIELDEKFPFGIKNDKLRDILLKLQSTKNTGILDAYPLSSLNEYLKLVKVVKKILKKLNIPLLLIQSIYDEVSKYKSSLYIQENYGGICDVHLLNNSYHLIHIDQQRQIVAKQTSMFFNYYNN